MSVAMALFELLQLFLIFLDHPRIEYLWHVPIMPPINQKGISSSEDAAHLTTCHDALMSLVLVITAVCEAAPACSETRTHMRSVPVKPYPESEHIILECECDEKLVILGFEDDWRSRQAV